MDAALLSTALIRELLSGARRSQGVGLTSPSSSAARRASVLSGNGPVKQQFQLGSLEPAAVTLLKELPGPLVLVATFTLCFLGRGQQLSVGFAEFELVAFLLADRVLSTPEWLLGPSGALELRPTFSRLILEWVSIYAVLAFLAVALHLVNQFPLSAWISWFFVAPAALLVCNYCSVWLARWWTVHRSSTGRHIIIGATEVGLELARRVGCDRSFGHFMGFFDFRDRNRLPELTAAQWGGTCTEVADFIRHNAIESIYIALPISSAPRIAQLMRELHDTTASIYFLPDVFGFALVQPRCLEIQGIPALALCDTPFRGMPALRKRAVDLLLGTLLLVVSGPLLIATAIAVKLSSPGPALFKQRRYGLNGEEISVYKFRSMRVCEDHATIKQATRNDDRVTRIGRFLRRTSLDELPQILNVLEGKMSIVGPRPHAVAHNEQYRRLISGYMIRHKVRPGITGWAQVNGLRGETDDLEKMRRRIEYDIYYLNNWSLWLDLKILLRTLWIVIRDEHAY
jgi:putative colanic acid biosynthesis UDP-glucose lipid carrier transferase